MDSSLVLSNVENNICYITLNRARKRNAITMEMMDELGRAFDAVNQQDGVRAVIVRADGPVFSAGIDVMSLGQARAEAGNVNAGRWLRRLAEKLQYVVNRVESTELPVIGALHGHVLGLGHELALAFDLRIAASDCQIGLPETRLGLIADVGGTTRLSKLVGPSRAKDMLMTARSLDAKEALEWGLVNRVVEPENLEQAATALAVDIAQNAPLAVGLAKVVVDQGDGLPKYTQMAIERLAQSQLITTEDFGEAIAAFMEKRSPDFKVC